MALTPDRPRANRGRILLALIAVAGLVITPPRAWVENVYSNHIYPFFQRPVVWLANVFPFALSDLILIASVLMVLTWIGLAIVRPRAHGLALFRRLVVFLSLVVIAGGLISGLNMRRQGLRETQPFRKELVTHDSVLALAHRSVREMNALYSQLPTQWPTLAEMSAELKPAFRAAAKQIGTRWNPAIPRPKHTIFDRYTRMVGLNGYFTPFADEIILTKNLLPFERSYTLTHEWGHALGRLDESEAAYVGWLACMHGPPYARYSAWVRIYGYAAAELSRDERRALVALIEPGPWADLRAAAMRGAKDYSPRVSKVTRSVERKMLTVSRVPPRMQQYGLVVQLILGLSPD